ncbi:MAG: arginine repressor [Chlorobium sp.]|jgi:transcriptional regulator of arginine metabolism|nr:MAG: arginine repressor [Chlorobium sp.]
MNKNARQMKIREILQQNQVGNQHDLLQLLRDSGMMVAQATLSRDCAELGLVRTKTNGSYRLLYPDDNAGMIIKGLVGVEVLAITSNETTVIIRTLPGRAHGVGSYLDQLRSPLILGTIAGDDTVLVIPASVANISTLLSYIHKNVSKN